MAKKPARQVASPGPDGVPPSSILEELGVETPKGGAGGGTEPTTADLLKQIEGLSASLKEVQDENRELSRAQSQFFTGITTARPVEEAPRLPEVDLTGLPDPIKDQAGFSKTLNERLSAAITKGVQVLTAAEQARQGAQASQQAKADEMWEDFTELYPELAEYEDFVEVATRKVLKKAQRRGVNVQAMISTRPETFYKDVAEETQRILAPVLEAGDEAADGERPEPGAEAGPDAEATRTAGVFGGIQSGGQPNQGGASQDPGLVADLKEVQRKTGFF